ncbi:MAG TPA: hypothetical protein VG370_01965 [Chloroflexota bacterium]|nr:hypothetical protein [Chloroflexota bacterium]
MARRKKKLKQDDLTREDALELPNREAMSLLDPGLGIIGTGATQPGLGGTNPLDGTTGTPTGTTPTPTDTTGLGGLTGSSLQSKATRIIGPLPPTGA